jgi:probable HAF family extracellular repeat protein
VASETRAGFLLDNGVFTPIDAPGAVLGTAPYGINNRGQIVGAYVYADGTGQGFLLDNGGFTPIDTPGAGAFTVAFGINNRGRIVDVYDDTDHTAFHARGAQL